MVCCVPVQQSTRNIMGAVCAAVLPYQKGAKMAFSYWLFAGHSGQFVLHIKLFFYICFYGDKSSLDYTQTNYDEPEIEK